MTQPVKTLPILRFAPYRQGSLLKRLVKWLVSADAAYRMAERQKSLTDVERLDMGLPLRQADRQRPSDFVSGAGRW